MLDSASASRRWQSGKSGLVVPMLRGNWQEFAMRAGLACEQALAVRHSPEVHSYRIGERLLLPKLLMHHLGLRLVRVEFELL